MVRDKKKKMLVSNSTNEVEDAVVVDVLIEHILWGGCKITVRAAGCRDTEVGEWGGYSDHNDVHTHTHSHSVSSFHSSTFTYALTESQVAHTGILHLFHSTRGVVGSDVSDRDQGSD